VRNGSDKQKKYSNFARAIFIQDATVEVIKYFVESEGIDINALVQLTLGEGVNAKTITLGDMPLHIAASNHSNAEVLKYLISVGADVNVKNKSGKTPLDVANTEEKKRILRGEDDKSVQEIKPSVQLPNKDIFDAAESGTTKEAMQNK
jgi:hypothetical protein